MIGKRSLAAATLLLFALAASARAGDEEIRRRTVEKRIGGERIRMYEARTHYGSVLIDNDDRELADGLALALFGKDGMADRVLREWGAAEADLARRYREGKKTASTKAEKERVARLRFSFLDSGTMKEIARSTRQGEPYALSRGKVEPLSIELYSDRDRAKAVKAKNGANWTFGEYFPAKSEGVVGIRPSPLVTRFCAGLVCAQHLFDKYLDGSRRPAFEMFRDDRKSWPPFYRWRNHWLVYGLLSYYSIREYDPKLWIPMNVVTWSGKPLSLTDHVSQDPAKELLPYTGSYIPVVLGFVRERDQAAFYRLLAATLGRFGTKTANVQYDGFLDHLGIGAGGEWSNYDEFFQQYDGWCRERIAEDPGEARRLYDEWRKGWDE